MSDSTQPPMGLFGSLRRLAKTGIGGVQNRIELIGVELQEEKLRLVELLLWVAAGVFLSVVAVVTLTVAVAFLVSETVRPYFLLGAGLIYLAAATVAIIVARGKTKKGPAPFAETVNQLKKDREWLESLNGN